MPRNGSGTWNPPSGSWTNPINGQAATSGDWTALLNDIASALTQSVSRDGQSPLTGNLNLGGNAITGLADASGTGQALTFAQLFNQGTEQDLASAATTDIGAQLTNFLRITGTTTITSFGTNYKGPRFLRFAGAVLLTNSSTLILPGGANITTAAGDCLIVVPKATLGTADGWQVVAYQSSTFNPTSPTFTNLTTTNLTTTNNINVPNTFGFKNRLINAQGLINQRGYVSGTATTTSNQYTVDRWRVVTSGQNLTFSTTANEVTFTAPAGGVEQVIEGLNLESGTYALSWTGTATATVAGSAVTNGGTVTVTGGTNTTVKFSSGTFKNPQFEKGSTATSFDYRPYGTELALCQRYYYQYSSSGLSDNVYAYSPYSPASYTSLPNTSAVVPMYFPVTMRTAPTVSGTPNAGSLNRANSTTGLVVFQWSSTLANSAYAVTAYTATAEL